jgi:hypothetical protein
MTGARRTPRLSGVPEPRQLSGDHAGQFILNQDADCAHPHSNAVKAALFFISAVGSLPTWLFHGRRRHSSVLAQSSTLASAIDRAGGQSNYPKMHANPTVLVHWQPEAQTAAGKQLPLR